jgi:hypothetical protein
MHTTDHAPASTRAAGLVGSIAAHPIASAFAGVVAAFALKVIIAIVVVPMMPNAARAQPPAPDGILLIWLVSLPIETLVGQALPCFLLKKLGFTWPAVLIVVSATLFAALHIPYGPLIAVVVLGPSLVLSTLWVAYRRLSFAYALIGVTAVHYLHNVLSLAFR